MTQRDKLPFRVAESMSPRSAANAAAPNELHERTMTPIANKPQRIPIFKWLPNLLIFIICCSYGVTALGSDLRVSVPLLVGTSATIVIALAVTWYCGERGGVDFSPWFILFVALIVRLPFLFSPPQLSDDIYRYLWDGLRLLKGANPYSLSPAAVSGVSPFLATLRSQVNHAELVTIYPPAAQVVFAAGAALGGGLFGVKLVLVFCDLLLCLFIVRLLDLLGLPRWRAVLYALSPLPVLEIAGSGHVDGVGILFLFLSFVLLVEGAAGGRGASVSRAATCGALAGFASLVKLFPLVFLPALILFTPARRRWAFVTGFAAAIALLLLPFWDALPNLAHTLKTYAKDWEFAGFAFNLLRRATGSGFAARVILGGTFLGLLALFLRSLARGLSRCRPAQEENGAFPPGDLSAPSPAALTPTLSQLRSCGALMTTHGYRVAFAFLLLTPTLQPWYALYLAAFLPFAAGPGGFVLCWSVFLSYRVLIPYTVLGSWQESAWVTGAIFLAPVAAGVMAAVARRGSSSSGFASR